MSRGIINLSMALSFFMRQTASPFARFFVPQQCTLPLVMVTRAAPDPLTDNATVLRLFPCHVLFFSLKGEIGTAISMPEISAVEVGHQKVKSGPFRRIVASAPKTA
jgi:hypothetical protein